ncbi:hypothetical protein DP939_24840 [Spongiactinospora rosea]|uniref:Glycosyltransferase 2-like domain-containing protein n=1 Tax=Spongiactinospora rosea TaxID=2248750 RepID=A0A366LUG7_9ACTN|nr:glycosyltransferase [Spongiactinospora rosea]RBQ17588.1 hypothetical protein DP939_24840 [Spongiactinospora rosea]
MEGSNTDEVHDTSGTGQEGPATPPTQKETGKTVVVFSAAEVAALSKDEPSTPPDDPSARPLGAFADRPSSPRSPKGAFARLFEATEQSGETPAAEEEQPQAEGDTAVFKAVTADTETGETTAESEQPQAEGQATAPNPGTAKSTAAKADTVGPGQPETDRGTTAFKAITPDTETGETTAADDQATAEPATGRGERAEGEAATAQPGTGKPAKSSPDKSATPVDPTDGTPQPDTEATATADTPDGDPQPNTSATPPADTTDHDHQQDNDTATPVDTTGRSPQPDTEATTTADTPDGDPQPNTSTAPPADTTDHDHQQDNDTATPVDATDGSPQPDTEATATVDTTDNSSQPDTEAAATVDTADGEPQADASAAATVGDQAGAGVGVATLTVVVVGGAKEGWERLKETMAAIEGQRVRPDEVILVIDHNVELAAWSATEFDGVTVLAHEGTRGSAAARNRALAAARGDVVAFLDDETAPDPDWTERLLEAYADPEVVAVRSRLAIRWEAGRPNWFPNELAWVVGAPCTGAPDDGGPIDDLYGAGLSLRRETLFAAGGFPEDLDHQAGGILTEPPAGAKTELWLRLRDLAPGAKLVQQPSATLRVCLDARRGGIGHLVSRCAAEGKSLAAVPQRAQGRAALGAHLAPIRAGLPRAVFRMLTATGPRDVKAWRALAAMLLALVATTVGYLNGRLQSTRTDEIRRTSTLTWFVARTALPVATVLWGLSLRSVDLDAMTDLGLITVMPATFWAAIVVMVVGFVALLSDKFALELWHAGYVLILIAVLHATPALLYPTLRYSWAWKHVSVIDYLIRHGVTDPDQGPLSAYHQWPGFFSFFATMTQMAGLGDALTIASWGPLAFNTATLLPLLLLFRTVTRNRQLVWGGVWVFFSCSWVGQDYFSPQATTLVMYLTILAVMVRRFRRGPIRAGTDPDGLAAEPPPITSFRHRLIWATLLLIPIVAITSAHQLTPLMLVGALAALFVLRRYRNLGLLLVTAVAVGAWDVVVAWQVLESRFSDIMASLGDAGGNLSSGLIALGTASPGQVIVAYADRALSVGLWGLALCGAFVRRRWLRRPGLPLLMIGIAPLAFLAGGSYGGEIIFRVYLFALPLTALLAAAQFLPARRTWVRVLVLPVVLLLMVTGFFFGNYGKEQSNYFTTDEVHLVRALHRIAPEHSLIVAPTFFLPAAYDQYERFDHVWLDELPPSRAAVPDLPPHVPTLPEFVKDPRPALIDLMGEVPPGAKAYLVLNRAQRPATETAGIFPKGTIDRLVREISGSGRFRQVLGNDGGVVYELLPQTKAGKR